jgi:hypothetical protein
MKSDTVKFAKWHRAMLEEGVYLAPSQFEAGCFPLSFSRSRSFVLALPLSLSLSLALSLSLSFALSLSLSLPPWLSLTLSIYLVHPLSRTL